MSLMLKSLVQFFAFKFFHFLTSLGFSCYQVRCWQMLRFHFVIYKYVHIHFQFIIIILSLFLNACHVTGLNCWRAGLSDSAELSVGNTLLAGNPTETDIWVIMRQNKWDEWFCPEANWRVKTQMCDVILIYSVEPLCWRRIGGWLCESEISPSYSAEVILNSVTVTFSTSYNLFSAALYSGITNSD